MTKAELVEEVSRVSDLTKKHSEVIVDTVFRSIIDALHRGEKIELRGFGSFRLRKREPRKGVDAQRSTFTIEMSSSPRHTTSARGSTSATSHP